MNRIIAALAIMFFAAPAFAVGLAWNASTGTVAGYRIYQSDTAGSYNKATQKVADVGQALRQATVTIPVQDGRTVYFVATAYDAAGNESGFSNEVSYVTPDTIPPGIPGDFRLTVEMTLNEHGQLTMSLAQVERLH